MKAITLRNIPEPIAKRIRERADRSGASYNRVVLEMLEEQTAAPRRRAHHELDHLAGSWSNEDASAFERTLGEQRVIDEAEWK